MEGGRICHDVLLFLRRLDQCLSFRITRGILIIIFFDALVCAILREVCPTVRGVFGLNVRHWDVFGGVVEVSGWLGRSGDIFGDVGGCQFCHCMRAFIVGDVVVLVGGRDCLGKGIRCVVFVLIRSQIVTAPGNSVDEVKAKMAERSFATVY